MCWLTPVLSLNLSNKVVKRRAGNTLPRGSDQERIIDVNCYRRGNQGKGCGGQSSQFLWIGISNRRTKVCHPWENSVGPSWNLVLTSGTVPPPLIHASRRRVRGTSILVSYIITSTQLIHQPWSNTQNTLVPSEMSPILVGFRNKTVGLSLACAGGIWNFGSKPIACFAKMSWVSAMHSSSIDIRCGRQKETMGTRLALPPIRQPAGCCLGPKNRLRPLWSH